MKRTRQRTAKGTRSTAMDREEAMTLAAWLYYEREMDQSEVARRMGLSRSHVSRLLLAARERGIVTVRVNGRLPETWRLEQQLESTLHLRSAVVAMPVDSEEPRVAAARSGARLLDEVVLRPTAVGLGWGRTLGLIGRFARQQETAGVRLYDIVGRPVWPTDDPPYEVSEILGRAYNAPVGHVPAPAVVENPDVAKALRRDPLVSGVLQQAADAEVMVVALGNVDPVTSSLVLTGAVTAEGVTAMASRGAVGEVIGHYFDRDGMAVESPLDARIVGLTLDEVRSAKYVVAVAAGPDKVESIRGAAAGGLIGGLVTDRGTAELLVSNS